MAKYKGTFEKQKKRPVHSDLTNSMATLYFLPTFPKHYGNCSAKLSHDFPTNRTEKKTSDTHFNSFFCQHQHVISYQHGSFIHGVMISVSSSLSIYIH